MHKEPEEVRRLAEAAIGKAALTIQRAIGVQEPWQAKDTIQQLVDWCDAKNRELDEVDAQHATQHRDRAPR